MEFTKKWLNQKRTDPERGRAKWKLIEKGQDTKKMPSATGEAKTELIQRGGPKQINRKRGGPKTEFTEKVAGPKQNRQGK